MNRLGRLTKQSVLEAEWKRVYERRRVAFGSESSQELDDDQPKDLTGLALSGGGLRSAMFNDGFLQALSHRGLLRYVDYLSSVSGGGYIASRLSTVNARRANAEDEGGFFAEESTGRQSKPAWHLGKDPKSGAFVSDRLQGVGRYLTGVGTALPSYLVSMLTTLCVYLGILGICATLIAMFWRSFDDPKFRFIVEEVLDYRWGGELLIAFYPAIIAMILLASLLVVKLGLRIARHLGIDRIVSDTTAGLPAKLETPIKYSLYCTLGACVVSLAIFAGNGFTPYSEREEPIFLNGFAQTLAVTAGLIQIIAFLGRDQLFRSEKDEAGRWQKYIQKLATTGVIAFSAIVMVHWMGSEDLSGYTRLREPYLVRGEVLRWPLAEDLFESYPRDSERHKPAHVLDPRHHINRLKLNPADSWEEHIVNDWLSDGREGGWMSQNSAPPTPLQYNERSKDRGSLFSIVRAYCECLPQFSPAAETPANKNSDATPQSIFRIHSNFRTVENYWISTNALFEAQEEAVADWNMCLDDPSFTIHLIDKAKLLYPTLSKSKNNGKSFRALSSLGVIGLLSSTTNSTSEANTLDAVLEHDAELLPQSVHENLRSQWLANEFSKLSSRAEKERLTIAQKRQIASLNRDLLQNLLPGCFQDPTIASTPVVFPHDQDARKQWLVVWFSLFGFGQLLTFCSPWLPSVYKYYRRRISYFFLHEDEASHTGKQDMVTLTPTKVGLPHPLILACKMTPTHVAQGYEVRSEPFVFSPVYCGNISDDASLLRPETIGLRNERAAVSLADAVTLSGAAISPFMTQNRGLSIVLSVFGSGLGRYVRPIGDHKQLKESLTQKLGRWRANVSNRLQSKDYSVVAGGAAIVIASCVCIYLLSFRMNTRAIGLLIFASLTSSLAFIQPGGMSLILKQLIWPEDATKKLPSKSITRRSLRSRFSYATRKVTLRLGLLRPMQRLARIISSVSDKSKPSWHIADGGFVDYLGVTELLKRRCELIVVSDSGAHLNGKSLAPLASLCRDASTELGIQFLDFDHEAPMDFERLKMSQDKTVHQPFLLARIRYPDREETGTLVYCQMAITPDDPLEIQQVRHQFPSFPDEPTTNQFYTNEQVAAYRSLGYHIGSRVCSELNRWSIPEIDGANTERDAGRVAVALSKGRQPLFDVLKERLGISYRLACYLESSYRSDDIFSEAIWSTKQPAKILSTAQQAFMQSLVCKEPSAQQDSFRDALRSDEPTPERSEFVRYLTEQADRWLSLYERNADIRSKYRHAIVTDVNTELCLHAEHNCCAALFAEVVSDALSGFYEDCQAWQDDHSVDLTTMLTCHLTTLGVACHEIHFGRPNAIFQVGGRQKLVTLATSLALVIGRALGDPPDKDQKKLQSCVREFYELQKCTFAGGEDLTVVSFAMCTTLMWAALTQRSSNSANSDFDVASDNSTNNSEDAGTEVSLAKLRIAVHRSITHSDPDPDCFLRSLNELWQLAYRTVVMEALSAAAQLVLANQIDQSGEELDGESPDDEAPSKPR